MVYGMRPTPLSSLSLSQEIEIEDLAGFWSKHMVAAAERETREDINR